jgi:gluconolactonase
MVDPNAEPEVLAAGFSTTEGPVWDLESDRLIFNDVPGAVTYEWSEGRGLQVLREESNKACGAAIDLEGRLLTCEHATSQLTRWDGDERTVIADKFDGAELNSPNDVIVDRVGRIYFTDPHFGRLDDHYGRERPYHLDFRGVYLVDDDGTVVLLADDFETPNGLCLSPDGAQMYVNDTFRSHIRRFDVAADGTLSGGSIFFTMNDEWKLDNHGSPDGMKVDSEGNVYCTGPGGVWVIDPDGNHLGIIRIPARATNFTFGGPDLSWLYATAANGHVVPGTDRGWLCRLPTMVSGSGSQS